MTERFCCNSARGNGCGGFSGRLLWSILLLAALPFAHAQTGARQGQSPVVFSGSQLSSLGLPESTVEIAEITQAIEDASYFRELEQVKLTLDGPGNCGPMKDKARESLQTLRALNEEFRNLPTAKYQEEAYRLKEENARALEDYQRCYDDYLANYAPLAEAGVNSYASHKAEYNRMLPAYDSVPNISEFIEYLKLSLDERGANRAPGDVFGTLTLDKQVSVLPRGRGDNWIRVSAGYKISIDDHVRTGPTGFARIVVTSRYLNGATGGKAVINLGSNSHFKPGAEFAPSFGPKPSPFVSLIRGTLRTFLKNQGFRSSFKVRTGTNVLGIRGTEVAIFYDPAKETAEVMLDHGDAYIEAGGRIVDLEPRTRRTVRGAEIGAARPLDDKTWNNVLAATGSGRAESLQTADADVSEIIVKPNTSASASSASPNTEAPAQTPPTTPPSANSRAIGEGGNSDPAAKSSQSRVNANKKDLQTAVRVFVRRYLEAVRRNDLNTALSLAAGQSRANLLRDTKNASLKEALDKSGRPMEWRSDCAACEPGGGSELARCRVFNELRLSTRADFIPFIFQVSVAGDNQSELRVVEAAPKLGKDKLDWSTQKRACEAQ